MSAAITAHGHATFSLNIDGMDVVIDPFFADKNPAAKKSVSEISADYILITHGHSDHVADAIPLAERTGAQIITNPQIMAWIQSQGYNNTTAMMIGQSHSFAFGTVQMTKAEHGSQLPENVDGGLAAGFIIFTNDETIYIAGDTSLFPEMQQIGDAGLDIAVIPSGGKYTMNPNQALEALDYLRPKIVIPCHYNSFPHNVQDIDAWKQQVEQETSTKVVLLNAEQTFEM